MASGAASDMDKQLRTGYGGYQVIRVLRPRRRGAPEWCRSPGWDSQLPWTRGTLRTLAAFPRGIRRQLGRLGVHFAGDPISSQVTLPRKR